MRLTVTLLILAAALLSGCSAARFERTAVSRQADLSLALERVAGQGGGYRHPCRVEVADLRYLLGQLAYREQAPYGDEERQAPVFQPAEIDRLAPLLADALAGADADRRVRFLSFNLEPGTLFSQSRKSEGVFFAAEGERLQIAFNYINAKRLPAETSAQQAPFADLDPLSIAAARTALISRPPLLNPVSLADGRPAPLRLSVDLAALRAARAAAPPSAPPAPAAAAPFSPAAPAPAPPAALPLQQEIREKLKYLKELLVEGLISEQDFETRKRELLDRL